MSKTLINTGKFCNYLQASTGYDLSEYSDKSLSRRIQKLIDDYKMNFVALITKIKSDKEFGEKVLKDITVNTTELFRNPKSWHCVKYKILPALKDNEKIRIWHAGCSTGQEVYSMMILLKELNLFDKAEIIASDINKDVITKAKTGIYRFRFNLNYLDNFDKVIKENPFNFDDYNNVSYNKYFKIDKAKDIIIINKEFRDKPKWVKHDLVQQNLISYKKFNIIFCRNVLIYFNVKLQNKTIRYFYDNLLDNGFLILGAHESIIGEGERFFKKKYRYYEKK